MCMLRASIGRGQIKIVTGYTDDKFGTNDPVTREQMAAILYRYAQYKGYDVSKSADLTGFADANSISGYALTPMQWANAVGLITGTSATTLSPCGQHNPQSSGCDYPSLLREYRRLK